MIFVRIILELNAVKWSDSFYVSDYGGPGTMPVGSAALFI